MTNRDPGSFRFLADPHHNAEICDDCGEAVAIGDWPYCPHGEGHGHNHMVPYTLDLNGKQVVISSMQDATRIERESMKAYRNGEGAPYVFRAFHQDGTNRDRNTLDSLGYKQHTPNRTKRGTPIRGGSFKPDD